ncbi:hypothetical protein GFK91_15095 [Roseibium aggregatum]|uniref:restriction endonuclease subunit S n=1 Tax=Roseibium aggregatum TaxID=187304 RepID=UPI001E2BE84C|nr:restriction endonuclease subunit S [Roseibium aggregatum]UES56824.1 hypothetical protein GFK91_15095 [Roseibium aggregatum]
MVPEGWEQIAVGEFVDTIMGYAFSSKSFVPEGTPLVRMGNLYQNQLDLTRNPIFLPTNFPKEYPKFTLVPGDLIMSMTGTLGKRDYGFVVKVPDGTELCMLNQRVMKIIPKANADVRFLPYLLRSDRFLNALFSLPGGTKQANLSAIQVKGIELYLPPLQEQKKIAEILSTWDFAIETTEKLLANAEAQKKALMQQLLTGKRRLEGFKGEWREVKLGELLAEVKRPVAWSDDELYRLLSVRRRSGGLFHREDLLGREILTKNLKHAREGDFLISKMQVVHGAMALVKKPHCGMQVSNSYIAVVSRDATLLDIEFFDWLSRMPEMYHKAYLCSYGVHIEKMTFNFDLFLKESVNIPKSAEEQARIVKILVCAEKTEQRYKEQILKLQAEKQALMQQVLTGRLRVSV